MARTLPYMRPMRFAFVLLLALGGCAAPGDAPARSDPGLFRDFTGDGKFDELGHPSNARHVDASSICPGLDRSSGELCRGALPGSVQAGEMILNLRIRVRGARTGRVLDVDVSNAGDSV